jgi:hypothetical protein
MGHLVFVCFQHGIGGFGLGSLLLLLRAYRRSGPLKPEVVVDYLGAGFGLGFGGCFIVDFLKRVF